MYVATFRTELKSIMLVRPCIIISLLFLITIIRSVQGVSDHQAIIDDIVTDADFEGYVSSLEKIINFCLQHKLYVDLDLEFGLFLINVNLKTILQMKSQSLPGLARYRLEQILLKNEELTDYFHYMVRRTGENIIFAQDKRITKLFYNDTTWPPYVQKYHLDLLRSTKAYSPAQLEKIYGKWDIYEYRIYDYDQYRPSPEDSDACMSLLSDIPSYTNTYEKRPNCQTPPECKLYIDSGSEFGYYLSHRMLYMIVARFARACTVYSVNEDKHKLDRFCMRSFIELQYIASHHYKLPDLMMEHIALCTLVGHAQFLRRSWLTNLLMFQTEVGCFSENLDVPENTTWEEGKNDRWKLTSRDQSMMGGKCSGHITAVGAGMLSAALRYIMENYY